MKTFDELWAELREKAETRPAGSGTVAALDAGVHQIGKKLVEEAAECWMAAEHESRDRTAEEVSQLIYHAQVLMLASGLVAALSLSSAQSCSKVFTRCHPIGGRRRRPRAASGP